MTRPIPVVIALLVLTLVCGCGTSEPPWPEDAAAPGARVEKPLAPATPPPAPQTAQGALGNLPLAFEENQGQFDSQALFATRHGTGTFFFTADSMAAVFTRTVKADDSDPADRPGGPDREEPAATENFALKIHFLGTSDGSAVAGEDPLQGKVSYFRGKDPEGWVSGASTFGRIVYHSLWPGVDLAYSGSAGRLKAEYRLERAGDAGLIRLRYEGQDELRLDERGRLVIATPWGDLYEESPRAVQHKRPVDIAYGLDENTGVVGFRLDSGDLDAPLVINP